MYPIKVKFHGIRDFQPTKLNLGHMKDNVLIGGKNGSGKSTIVYAMAFAMASSSTNLWALRSKNLEENQPWNAGVGIMFHNPPGNNQKDAPEYVECAAEINAADTSRYTVKYIVYGGNHPRHMERLKVFNTRISAEEYYQRVFSIDADGFFMFWYQGTITDFANISDAERFQRVSEMFGIDRYETEWKKAMEALAEGERNLNISKRQKIDNERTLRTHEKNKNDLLTRNKIRDEAVTGIHKASGLYCGILNDSRQRLDAELWNLDKEHKEMLRKANTTQVQKKNMEEKKMNLTAGKSRITQNLGTAEKIIKQLDLDIDRDRQLRDQLDSEVTEIKESIKKVRLKEELNSLQGSLNEKISSLEKQIEEKSKNKETKTEDRRQLDREFAITGQKIDELSEKFDENKELDKKLPAAEDIIKELDEYGGELKATRESLVRDRDEKQKLRNRLEELEQNKSLITQGQKELVGSFKSIGIEAAAFGELFDVINEAERDNIEKILEAVKHTVFVSANPSNKVEEGGFYIVSVDKFTQRNHNSRILELLSIPDTVKNEYSNNFVQRALNWLSLIGIGDEISQEDTPGLIIYKGVLMDGYGARGPVKRGPAIGIKALELEKKSIKSQISMLTSRINSCLIDEKELEELTINLQADLKQREMVNRELPLLRKGLEEKKQRYDTLEQELDNIKEQLEDLERHIKDLEENKHKCEFALQQVDSELEIHKKYEQQAEKIAKLEQLNVKIRELERKRKEESEKRNKYSEQRNDIDKQLEHIEVETSLVNAQLKNYNTNIEDMDKKIIKMKEELDDINLHIEELNRSLEEIKTEFANLYDRIIEKNIKVDLEKDPDKISSKYLDRKISSFQNRLQDARNRNVLENAEERYNTFLKTYNESSKQLEEAEIKFKQLKKDEENRKDDLKKMVNKRYIDTNRLFKQYMSMLNLEGEIRNVPPEEGKDNDSYKWDLMVATRQGHKLEKVDRESSRRAKKGSGISGGERAATSLMFALSLLSQIQVKPPFYVLDEFDSALDEGRKHIILDLYVKVLEKKILIISPKIHGKDYLDRFGIFHCVYSNPDIQKNREISEVYQITRTKYEQEDLEE